MAVNRGAALAWALMAGTIASRNGSATVAPRPRMNVRRGNASFVITIRQPPKFAQLTLSPTVLIRVILRHSHCKRCTGHNPLNKRLEPVIVACGIPFNRPHRRRIDGLQPPPERIDHELFRHGRQEL